MLLLPEPWGTAYLILNVVLLVALVLYRDDYMAAVEAKEAKRRSGKCRECGLFFDDHEVYGDRLMGHKFKSEAK